MGIIAGRAEGLWEDGGRWREGGRESEKAEEGKAAEVFIRCNATLVKVKSVPRREMLRDGWRRRMVPEVKEGEGKESWV